MVASALSSNKYRLFIFVVMDYLFECSPSSIGRIFTVGTTVNLFAVGIFFAIVTPHAFGVNERIYLQCDIVILIVANTMVSFQAVVGVVVLQRQQGGCRSYASHRTGTDYPFALLLGKTYLARPLGMNLADTEICSTVNPALDVFGEHEISLLIISIRTLPSACNRIFTRSYRFPSIGVFAFCIPFYFGFYPKCINSHWVIFRDVHM